MGEVAVRPGRVQLIRVPSGRGRGTLVGPADRVLMALAYLRMSGRLLNAADPVPDGRGGLIVNVRVRGFPAAPAAAEPAARPSWWTPRRVGVAAALALVVLTVIAAAGWLLLSWLFAHLWLVLLGLVVATLTGGGSCVTVVRVIHRH